MKPRLLVDMDGTIVDLMGATGSLVFDHPPCRWHFEGCCTRFSADEVFSGNIFHRAQPIEGAVDGVRKLMGHFDVRFVSTPWPTNHASASAKYEWIERHFGDPKLLTLTHDKALIPAVALVDDKPDLVGPWRHITYPQAWNESNFPTWRDGLAAELIHSFP